MKKHGAAWIGLFMLGMVIASCGCVDAVREGVTGGVRDGLSQLTSSVLGIVVAGGD